MPFTVRANADHCRVHARSRLRPWSVTPYTLRGGPAGLALELVGDEADPAHPGQQRARPVP